MKTRITAQKIAWSLVEVSESTGLSLGFLRNEVRAGRLPVKKFGRRTLVRDVDLQAYLENGSPKEVLINDPAKRIS